MHQSDTANLPVILVDDEEDLLFSSSLILRSAGIGPVETLQDSRKLLDRLAHSKVGVIVLDLYMPHLSGVELLPQIQQQFPDIPVIVMTAAVEAETAINCMKAGAFDYLIKPAEEQRFISSVQKALEVQKLRQQVASLKGYLLSGTLNYPEAFSSIITASPKMQAVFQYMEAISVSTEPVMINGETGVGKELIAQTLHQLSNRPGKLITANIAGLDDNLFSDTLFGHTRGAFTGADSTREGLIAKADGGTLFLDEIGDLPMVSQVKLLRLLQEHKYYPLGSDVPKACDVRIVAATNRDLQQSQAQSEFRPDLYYRLCTHQVQLPALSERSEDIPLLVNDFIKKAAKSMNKPTPTPPPELYTLLSSYGFPGNIRELRSLIYDAVARHQGGVLSLSSFKAVVFNGRKSISLPTSFDKAVSANPFSENREWLPTLKEAGNLLIEEALRRSNDNQGIAAAFLGISRQALNRRERQRQTE